ncbi:Lipopolysaccharide assembly protein A [Halomicronema hongdechloris C2206]|uniref:Lipopolysaccharide assembly protein A n=1 Tax=Halomicronema hongdechloris C2206 TaxID=1641165 RepID=A0A1Z3HU30_9CYAN|nr:lipopolysaccharide assembly protein LapA domain-containing protein [Halomicronema hongdechloris]ASC73820.1 Lipopolysaccharide assembly protein A [Halomicronema hongdechloris C2206]
MRLFVISALVIAFLAILFALQNNNLVTINLLVWRYEQSLALVLLATLAIGVLVGLLVSIPAIVRRGWRTARIKQQTDELVTQVQEKDQQMASQTHKIQSVRDSYHDLLEALGLIEPTTALLHQQALQQAATSLLQRRQSRSQDSRYQSLSLLLLQVEPTQPPSLGPSFWGQVAQRLQHEALIDSWLYSDGQGQFACTTPGLDTRETSRYGEALQQALTTQPIALADGTSVSVQVSVGGAIASADKPVDATILLTTAKTALDQAQQRGRNRFRLLQASPA